MTLDVLLVGAGPVGLVVAHELARRGVRVRLVDAAKGPAVTSRALATHPRSLEVYDQMGVLADLLPRGRQVTHFTLHSGRHEARMDADYSRLPTRFPFTLMIDQMIAEEVLRTAAARLGVEVEWETRLETFDDEGDQVRALLRHADGHTEEVVVPWLVGTDGGHSTVRKRLGLPLIGDSSETWLIADAQVDTDLPQNSIHWVRTPTGTVMLVPFPDKGKWRLLDTADASYDGDDDAVGRRFQDKIRVGVGQELTVHRPTWVSVFTIQQRMIPAMRKGRCFVAGDAAHVHSPASGQGLNTGIQDGYNLAWKLAMVVQGHAGTSLLDSYSAERVPVGRKLLGSTRTATGLVTLKSIGVLIGITVLRTVKPLRNKIERKIMGGMSALGLSYVDSPLTTSGDGERLLKVDADGVRSPGWAALVEEVRDPRWTLLVFSPSDDAVRLLDKEHGAWLSVRSVLRSPSTAVNPLPDDDGRLHADFGAGPGSWVLVRPDGYVSATGSGAVVLPELGL
jgi:NADPH-dependent dioxygenase